MRVGGEDVVAAVVAIVVGVVAAQNKVVVTRLYLTSLARIADGTDLGRGRGQPHLASPEMLQH